MSPTIWMISAPYRHLLMIPASGVSEDAVARSDHSIPIVPSSPEPGGLSLSGGRLLGTCGFDGPFSVFDSSRTVHLAKGIPESSI